MNTEPHYADGGEPHYRRVGRLGLNWFRANITKYAERTKGTPVKDSIKIADYALMELEGVVVTYEDCEKLMRVRDRLNMLLLPYEQHLARVAQEAITPLPIIDPSYPAAQGYVNQDQEMEAYRRDQAQLYMDSGGLHGAPMESSQDWGKK